MRKFTQPAAVKLADPDAERARDSTAAAIAELQGLAAVHIKVLPDIALPSGVEVSVLHGLGRTPRAVIVSPVRSRAALTAGLIVDYRGTRITGGEPIDSTQIIVIAAFGFGATVTVDVVVL